jgi:hypothetical protein
MSDHLPLWIELKIDFSNQYLEKIASETAKEIESTKASSDIKVGEIPQTA